jgi:hypothetical protein
VTFDIVALCREQPDMAVILAALREAGPKLKVHTIEEAQLVQLYHPDGRLLLTTEGARLVQVPGGSAPAARYHRRGPGSAVVGGEPESGRGSGR